MKLKQYALMRANKIKTEKPLEYMDDVASAYERATAFKGNICPHSWVDKNIRSNLVNRGTAREVIIYGCDKCNFETPIEEGTTNA